MDSPPYNLKLAKRSHSAGRVPPTRRAFTLMEVMIAVSIIAVVSVLLVTWTRATRESAAKVRCIYNLSQLGNLTFIYANDHGGRMLYYHYDRDAKYERWWRTELTSKGYLKDEKIAYCPSLVAPNPQTVQSYGMRLYNPKADNPEGYDNKNINKGELVTTYVHFSRISRPSTYPFYADSVQSLDYSVATRAGKQWHRFSINPAATNGGGIHLRHNGRANVWFADGHVESLDAKGLGQVGILSAYNEKIEPIALPQP
ncbi:MAG TPA: H-X9-DG-CTERM domain-containing protein [Chthoniobacteraceae bacterium]|nr:H-X9-DG-CTERM domain-containing protein [Chthoniobacteraceae bacterium]